MSASTCRPVSLSLHLSRQASTQGRCLFVIFVFSSSSVYIGVRCILYIVYFVYIVYIGVRWGSEVRGHLHLGSGEPSPTSGGENHPTIQLLCTTTTTSSTTTTRGRACPTLPTRGGEPPIKGTSPHHPPSSPSCISSHRIFGTTKKKTSAISKTRILTAIVCL